MIETAPVARKLTQHRILPMWSWTRFLPIRVDDDNSCRDQHILIDSRFHRYQDAKGRMWAIRCPLYLSHDEKARVLIDDPPGSWEQQIEPMRQERLRIEAARRLAEKQEARSKH